MRIKNILISLFLLCSASFQLNSRTSNITTAGAVDQTTDTAEDGKVKDSSVFKHSVFDKNKGVYYVGNTTATTGQNALMRVSLSGSTLTTTEIANGDSSDAQVKHLFLSDNGNLVFTETRSSADEDKSVAVVANPSGTSTPTTYYSATLQDGGAAATGGVDILCPCGTDSAGLERILASVFQTTKTEYAGDAAGAIRTITFDNSTPAAPVVTTGLGKINNGGTYEAITFDADDNSAPSIAYLIGYGGATGANRISNFSAIHWDPILKRVFIGTERNAGSSVAATKRNVIIVGRFYEDDTNAIVGAGFQNKDLLFEGCGPILATSDQRIISFENDDNFKVNHIKTLHTSTNKKPYLIVQRTYGTTLTDEAQKRVHCIPLVEYSTTGTSGIDTGKAATVSPANATVSDRVDHSTAASTEAGMYQEDQVQALVGGVGLPCQNAENITQVEVVGDTVFAVCTSTTSLTDENAHRGGVYASRPIFDSAGNIAGWTAWEKVVSSAVSSTAWTERTASLSQNDGIYKIGIDSKNGQFFYTLTKDNTADAGNGLGVARWGSGSASNFDYSLEPLVSKLNSDFPESVGGIWHMRNFPAFKTIGLGSSELTVVSGQDKVAVFSSGALLSVASANNYTTDLKDATAVTLEDRPGSILAYPKKSFEGNLNKHYKYFGESSVGRVLCSEVSRTPNTLPGAANMGKKHGFVFVGGEKGVAVLCKSDGTGFDCFQDASLTLGEDLEDFEGGQVFKDFVFKKLPGIDKPVHDLVSTGTFLYVLTQEAIYRIRLHSARGTAFLNTVDSDPTMFTNPSTATTYSETDTLAADDDDKVVVQKVFSRRGTELFTHMVGVPNSKLIFVASIDENQNSYVYAIKKADNSTPQGNPGGDSIFGTADADHFGSANIGGFRMSFPGTAIRKLAVSTVNYLNPSLKNPANATVDISTGAFNTGMLGDRQAVVGNLHILTGSVFDRNSKLMTYALQGNIDGVTAPAMVQADFYNMPVFSLISNSTVNEPKWAEKVEGSDVELGLLANEYDGNGMPFVTAHSSQGVNNHLTHVGFEIGSNGSSKTDLLESFSTSTGSNKRVFGSCRMASGAHMLFGDFGCRVSE